MRCFECGAKAHHKHHVIPKSMGGTKTVPLCTLCHGKAHGISISGPELTKRALRKRKADGMKYTKQTPYGFEVVGRKLVLVEAEAKVVAEIQAARDSGSTLQSIADSLNGRGIPTKTGKQWQPATIHLLLKRSALVSA